MERSPGLCALILAAGESSRMGRDKALLPWPPASDSGSTFLSSTIAALSQSADMVLVVVGSNESALAPLIYASGASLVRNPAPERGQFSSLQAGLREVLARGRDSAVITHVDRPAPLPDTVALLRRRFEQALREDKWAVVPEHGGRHGHPIFVARELIELFLKAPEGATARDVEHAHAARIAYTPVDDPRVVLNVNTPEEYAQLTAGLAPPR